MKTQIKISLPQEIVAKLKARAKPYGKPLATFVADMIVDYVLTEERPRSERERWAEAHRKYVEYMNATGAHVIPLSTALEYQRYMTQQGYVLNDNDECIKGELK
jgi:hypothetical protein